MLTILWHSKTGAARSMAQAVYAGANGAARLIPAQDAGVADMLSATGYVFVCPENLGTMTGVMKDLFDRTYYPLLGQIEGRAYSTVIAAGSAGQGAQAQIDQIVTGWRLRRVAEPMIIQLGAQTPEAIMAEKHVSPQKLQECQDLGAAIAEGLRLGIF